MSTPSQACRFIAQAVPRAGFANALRARISGCQIQPQRTPRQACNARRDHVYLDQRSLFTASHSRQADAAAVPRAEATLPSNSRPPPSALPARTPTPPRPTTTSLASGLSDQPIKLREDDPSNVDWSSSFHGLSIEPFKKEAADILMKPLDPEDVEIKADGIIYLPEIKYRRILNKAFGPGGWGLAPRGESIVTPKAVTREYALLAHGRLVSIARGEQDYFSPDGIPTATEGCKSNALMRCCKDLGVASELWDPRFVRKFKSEYTREVFVEHVVSKKKTKIWTRKGDAVAYPYKETKFGN